MVAVAYHIHRCQVLHRTFDGGGGEAGAVPDQGRRHPFALAAERLVERRDAVRVGRVDVRAVGDEQLHRGDVGIGGGPVEEGVAAGTSVDFIGVDAARELEQSELFTTEYGVLTQ